MDFLRIWAKPVIETPRSELGGRQKSKHACPLTQFYSWLVTPFPLSSETHWQFRSHLVPGNSQRKAQPFQSRTQDKQPKLDASPRQLQRAEKLPSLIPTSEPIFLIHNKQGMIKPGGQPPSQPVTASKEGPGSVLGAVRKLSYGLAPLIPQREGRAAKIGEKSKRNGREPQSSSWS